MPHMSPQPVEPFGVETERIGGEHWLIPFGEVDVATAPTLEHDLLAVERSDAQRIVLDLSRLIFMDSSGLHVLLRAHERSLANGRRLGIVPGSDAVQTTLRLTGAENRLPLVTPTVAASRAASPK
jgi:anti-sigma B factor antagonist